MLTFSVYLSSQDSCDISKCLSPHVCSDFEIDGLEKGGVMPLLTVYFLVGVCVME